MSSEDYEAGRRDGRLDALEAMVNNHKYDADKRFDELFKVQKAQDRTIWMLIGAFSLISFLPKLQQVLGI